MEPGSSRSRRGRKSSAWTACVRCSRSSAIPARVPIRPCRRHQRQIDGHADNCRAAAAGRVAVGAYTSPHVSGWEERLDTDAEGFERAVGRIRPAAERLQATQFEALTAAALAEFAAQGVDVAAIEAGLGGRLDATNVLDAPVVHLTNVSLEHTEVLGETREAIAERSSPSPGLARSSCSASRSGRTCCESRKSASAERRKRRRHTSAGRSRATLLSSFPAARVARGGRAVGRRPHVGGRRLAPGTHSQG